MYADDGLIYGEKPLKGEGFTIEDRGLPVSMDALLGRDMGDSGVQVHPEKSSWVRRDGVWMKPLLFLGLEYDGITDTLRGRTRKQRTEGTLGLEYDKDLLVAGALARDELARPLRAAALAENQKISEAELEDISRSVPVEETLAEGQDILDQLVSVEEQQQDIAQLALKGADQSGAAPRRTR